MAKRPELIDAIECDDFDRVEQILSDPEARQVSHAEMQAGCWQGNVKVVTGLLDHGGRARVKDVDPKDGSTLLHDAAKLGNAKVVKILLDLGVDASKRNNKGELPADLADQWQDPPNALSTMLRDAAAGKPPAAAPVAAIFKPVAPPAAPKIAAKPPPSFPVPKKPSAAANDTDAELNALLSQINDIPTKPPAAKPIAKVIPPAPVLKKPSAPAKPAAKTDDVDAELAALMAKCDAETAAAKAAAKPAAPKPAAAKPKPAARGDSPPPTAEEFAQEMIKIYGSDEDAAEAFKIYQRTGELPKPGSFSVPSASSSSYSGGGSSYSSSSSSGSSRAPKEKKVCGSCRGSGTSRCNFCSGTGQFQKKRCTHCKGGVNKCISCNGKG